MRECGSCSCLRRWSKGWMKCIYKLERILAKVWWIVGSLSQDANVLSVPEKMHCKCCTAEPYLLIPNKKRLYFLSLRFINIF